MAGCHRSAIRQATFFFPTASPALRASKFGIASITTASGFAVATLTTTLDAGKVLTRMRSMTKP